KGTQEKQFYVITPYDKNLATFGNGTMVSLLAESHGAVDEFYAAALANGGTDEGKPGPRSVGYFAYVRDPDGNKICAYCKT
ncbi:MAG: VOC family protein, partial [Thermomicrobiales bacterium]